MTYQRKSSKHIADAQERAAKLRGIDPALDLGNDLTLAAFNAEMAGGTRASEINYHPTASEEEPEGGRE